MSWRERLLRSLPLVAAIAGTTTFAVTDEQWALIITLVGVWLIDSPIPGTVAMVRALRRPSNVSRETSVETIPVNVSRETLTAPCAFMHGSAEAHVSGCEGWTSDQE